MPRTVKESRPRILTRTTSFDDLYEEGPEDECWIWQGSVDPSTGYGRYGKRRAHVIACERKEDRPPDKRCVLHSVDCTSRLCVNPAHLRWGTQAENMRDLAKVGNRKGEKAHNAKLTEEQVREIRSCNESTKALAERFGVHWVTIQDVRNRRTWSHIE
jgi:hypothetical protein